MSGTSKQQLGDGGKSPQCSRSVLPEEEADQIVNSGGGEVALKKGIEADQTVNAGGGEVALKKGSTSTRKHKVSSLSSGSDVGKRSKLSRSILPEEEADQRDNAGGGEVVLKKGLWTKEEDENLKDHIKKHGEGNWKAVQKESGLARCGKSCRLRWSNHLRPRVKKGSFTAKEECLIIEWNFLKGNKWAHMATFVYLIT
ncbi:unnamed protein product [Lathyrus sativus]|nr:unnamed protein product [Lathyrus sativus]